MLVALVIWLNMSGDSGFNVIWGYFAWTNQTLAVFTLWALTVYLVKNKKLYIVTLIPAIFMTTISVSYICAAPNTLALPRSITYPVAAATALVSVIWFFVWKSKAAKKEATKD